MDAVYRSKPIETKRQELRLVTIDPSSSAEHLACHLDSFSLSDTTPAYSEFLRNATSSKDTPEQTLKAWQGVQELLEHPTNSRYRFIWGDYAALSYTWGDPSDLSTITVNGVVAHVTKNLSAALHALRASRMFGGRYRLWIDALCINQKDVTERSEQVAAMRFFYTRAWSVVGFLGPSGDDSHLALELLEDLAAVSGDHDKCEAIRDGMSQGRLSHKPGSWLALNRLLLRPYWTRLWITQEIAIGGARVVLFCGSSRIRWSTLCDGVGVIHNWLWVVRHEPLNQDAKQIPAEDTRDWDATRALDHLWKNLRVLTLNQTFEHDTVRISRLLEIANTCSCYDDRDRIFGMLGVMDPRLARAIEPDYQADVATCFIQAAQAYIKTFGDLDLLRDANSWGRADLPSWVPDWTWKGRKYDSRPDDFYQKKNDEAWRRPYVAARNLPFNMPTYDGSRLVCQAIIFDTVDGLGSNAEAEDPNAFVQSTSTKSAYDSPESTAQNLAIALYAGRRPWPSDTRSILQLPTTMESAKEQFVAYGWRNFEFDLFHYHRWTSWYQCNASLHFAGAKLSEYFSDCISQDLDMEEAWTAYGAWVRTALAGCRRLMTTDAGRIGWASCASVPSKTGDSEVRHGDLVSILPGCSTPILLRSTSDANVYIVVGEAYVQGMMEGEIADLMKAGLCKLERISLC